MPSTHHLLDDPASVGVWTLDPEKSTIGFTAKSLWGLAPVKGRFTQFDGNGQITDSREISGRIHIEVASVHTKIHRRDEHLRSADFFEVTKFPDIRVEVTGPAGSADGDTVDLRAQLTVKDKTVELPLRAVVAVLGDGLVRLRAQSTIDRKQFGVDFNVLGTIPDKVTISGDVVFRRAG